MGLFNKLGRGVEQFTQSVKDAAKEEADYQCQACESWFHTDHDHCPECGAAEVEPVTDTE